MSPQGSSEIKVACVGAKFRAKPLEQAIIYELHIGTFTAEGTYTCGAGKAAALG